MAGLPQNLIQPSSLHRELHLAGSHSRSTPVSTQLLLHRVLGEDLGGLPKQVRNYIQSVVTHFLCYFHEITNFWELSFQMLKKKSEIKTKLKIRAPVPRELLDYGFRPLEMVPNVLSSL